MKRKVISSVSGFLVASAMIGGAYWVQSQRNLKDLEAQQSYIETLEVEIESLRTAARQELQTQAQQP